jgi:hypothetical protein
MSGVQSMIQSAVYKEDYYYPSFLLGSLINGRLNNR